jgi:hypothetical protein
MHMWIKALIHRDQDCGRAFLRKASYEDQEGVVDPVKLFVRVRIETTIT